MLFKYYNIVFFYLNRINKKEIKLYMDKLISFNRISKEAYKENKSKIKKLELLKFKNFEEDLKARIDNIIYDSYNIIKIFVPTLVIVAFLIIAVVPKVDTTFIHEHKVISFLLFLLVLLLFTYLIILFIRFLIKNYLIQSPKASLLFAPSLTIIIFYYVRVFLSDDLTILVLTILSCLCSIYVINLLPSYLDVDINNTITIFLTIITILMNLSFINIISFIKISLIVFLINLNIINIYLKHRDKKNEETAQEIFSNQLMIEDPSYTELLKCYSIGGKKYKDKIMETEKFLRIIKSKEVI